LQNLGFICFRSEFYFLLVANPRVTRDNYFYIGFIIFFII